MSSKPSVNKPTLEMMIELISVHSQDSLLASLKQMDKSGHKLLIVRDSKNKFEGLISIGDIQRAILSGANLSEELRNYMRDEIIVAYPNDDIDVIKERMLKFRMEFIPVLSEIEEIQKIIFWEDLFGDTRFEKKGRFSLPVVIMAGGQGSRLRPLTNVLPKPLVPIADKTMLEEIFDNFKEYGSNEFFISVNYKAELIEFYINSLELDLDIRFFREEKPLGTAGSLSLIKDKIGTTFFVSNCDILIDEDYSKVLDFHRTNNFEITIFGALKHLSIPYGTLEVDEGGHLMSLKEKPDLNMLTNSGMYILEPHLLSEIPDNQFLNITDLIEGVLLRKGKVGVFPLSEKSWRDIGVWSEYIKQSKIL